MKNIILILSLVTIFAVHGMDEEPLPNQEPSIKKPEEKKLLISNNTMKRHVITANHHLYRIRFHGYRWITTSDKTIKIDGKRHILDPENDIICLGAEPDWSDSDDVPRKRESTSLCEFPNH